MKKIYVDLDSTLNNLEVVWLDYCNDLHFGTTCESKHVAVKDLCHWNFFQDYFGHELAMGFFKSNPYLNISPRTGALNFILNLELLGYEVVIISAHSGNRYEEAQWKRAWIDLHLSNDIKLIVTHDKYLYTKGCILIDDSPKNCLMHIWHNKDIAYLFNYKDCAPCSRPLPSETYNSKLRYVTDYKSILKDIIENK